MDRIPAKRKMAIVRQYLSGMSYDEIAAKGGVSKGTVANIVTELKAGMLPEAADLGEHIDLLRELSLDLRRSGLTPGQCATGLTILGRIRECGLEPSDIDRWPLILKSARSEDEANQFVRLVCGIQEVQERTGLSLEELDDRVHDLERNAAELEPLSQQHETCRKELAELTRRREELAGEVATLERSYDLLNPQVTDLEKRQQALSRRTEELGARSEAAEAILMTLSKEKQRLVDTGLAVDTMAEFSHRVQSIAQRHHIAPAEFRDRLLQELESLGEGLRLETLVQRQQKELEEREQAVALATREETSLKTAIDSLKQEKAGLEASIRNTREKVGVEVAKMVPSAREAINGLRQELRRGHEEALKEVRRIRDEALEVGKEVGRCEEMLKANQWLSDLLDLARGEEGIEAKQVRTITLSVLRGASAWMRHNKANNPGLWSLSYTMDNLIKELEQWKV